MRCQQCSREVSASLNFCPGCGARLTPTATTGSDRLIPDVSTFSAASALTCPFCSNVAAHGETHCAACGGSLASHAANAPATGASGAGARRASTATSDAGPNVKPSAGALRRHWLLTTTVAAIVVFGLIAVIVANRSAPAESNASLTPAPAACSSDDLENWTNQYIALANRTQSAYVATGDTLSETKGARRIKARFARETAIAEKIYTSCEVVAGPLIGQAVVSAIRRLQAANHSLYGYYLRYLESGVGTAVGGDTQGKAVDKAVAAFNAAWEAFGSSVGFTIDDTPDPVIDETKEPD